MHCYPVIQEIFEECVQKRLSSDPVILDVFNLEKFLNQLQLASGIRKLHQVAYQCWLERENIQLKLKEKLPFCYMKVGNEAMELIYLSSL